LGNKKGEALFAEERKKKILEIIQQNKKITVTEVCKRYQVSPATARNDLKELEADSLLVRTHGGAIIAEKSGFEASYAEKKTANLSGKQKIAKRALQLIEDGDTIILDTGTSNLALAQQLSSKNQLTVVTNDFEIALVLENFHSFNLLFLGGFIRKTYHCTVGVQGREMLKGLVVDKAFIGANGISVKQGATTSDLYHLETKRAMLASANKNIFLCDQSKINKNAFAQFATLEEIDSLVIDQISSVDKRAIEENGVEIIVCN